MYSGASDGSDGLRRNSYACVCVCASQGVTTTCVRSVRRCAKRSWADFCNSGGKSAATPRQHWVSVPGRFRAAGVQTCKPGTHPGSHLLRCRHPAHARADRAFGPLADTVRCEPQTLQTLFSGRTVAQCCAVAPRIGISPGRTPFAWGGKMGSQNVSPSGRE